MKNKLFIYLTFFLTLGLIISSCESDIDKANEVYDWDKVIPEVFGVNGPTSVFQTFGDSYTVNYFRGGSTWNWTITDNATIESLSDDTRTADVMFPNDGIVEIYVTETTSGGITSDPDTVSVTVDPFCPLNDLNDLVGTWTGNDSEGNPTQVVTSVDGTDFIINGLNVGWMTGYWGEVIIDQVPLVMIMYPNGTLEIELQ